MGSDGGCEFIAATLIFVVYCGLVCLWRTRRCVLFICRLVYWVGNVSFVVLILCVFVFFDDDKRSLIKVLAFGARGVIIAVALY